MPDAKISALTAITTLTPATDVLPVVDVTGTTKKITTNQILGSGGTATLASATITGDLTVRTNKLAVTSTGVGIGTASPSVAADVVGSSAGATLEVLRLQNSGSGINTKTRLNFYAASTNYGAITGGFGASSPEFVFDINTSSGAFIWNNFGSEAMRLNSTGLGVGEAASVARLQPRGSTSDSSAYVIYAKNSGGSVINFMRNDGRFLVGNGTTDNFIVTETGNVGIGVTPSAWAAGFKSAQVGSRLVLTTTGSDTFFGNNFYNDGAYKFINADYATYYDQTTGKHVWGTSTTSGAVNGVITWNPAMTLSATGQLLLGTSTTNGAVDIGMVMNKPSATGFVGNVYQLNGVDKAFAYISSAAAAFRVDTATGYTINMVSATNGVYLANGGTSWTALSDERFKDIIEPISNAVAKVGSLRSVIGKFKTESEGTRRSFLIAQDVQAVLPEAVDASNPDQLGVAYTEVIPLLVAAIKELAARVQTLETR